MVEDEENKPDEGDGERAKAPAETAEVSKADEDKPSALDEAREINKKKEELLKREEKLQDRKEKLAAQEMVGGRATASRTEEKKPETNKEYRARVEKEMREGKTDFGD